MAEELPLASLFVINEKLRCDTLNDAIELANNIFWTVQCRTLMLKYNADNCTIEDVIDEFSGDDKTEEEKSNLNSPLPLNIPHIAAAVNTYGLFKGVEPEYINLSEKLVDLCKRVNRQTGVGYKRVILFTAMVT